MDDRLRIPTLYFPALEFAATGSREMGEGLSGWINLKHFFGNCDEDPVGEYFEP